MEQGSAHALFTALSPKPSAPAVSRTPAVRSGPQFVGLVGAGSVPGRRLSQPEEARPAAVAIEDDCDVAGKRRARHLMAEPVGVEPVDRREEETGDPPARPRRNDPERR